MTLTGKIALVTGATRGIGRAIAIHLGRAGAVVLGTSTSEQGAQSISAYLKEENIQGAGYALDVCDADAVKTVLAQIVEQFGAPNIVVNNAAINQDNLLLRMKPAQWDAVIDTNLNSIYRLSKACLKAMFKARWGRIINITSVVGVMGNPGQANYCAAKAGVIGFTKSLAQEMANVGITVNAIAPGFIDTDMTKAMNEKQRAAIEENIPMKKIGSPEDIANAALFLASDQASYMTGQTLHVNGGLYLA